MGTETVKPMIINNTTAAPNITRSRKISDSFQMILSRESEVHLINGSIGGRKIDHTLNYCFLD